ncbi:MAG: DUF1839 family protein [Paraburkholderia sp.]|nr:DUF1839 family protein [Paraburkholderia sp.]
MTKEPLGPLEPLETREPGHACLDSVTRRVSAYRPHPLHGPQMVWKNSNCSVDLWIEALSQWNMNPLAGLSFTATLDFEGDQFTFFKFPVDDLELLYGVVLQEHSIYAPLDVHVENQVGQERLMLVEVDAWHLPDTKGVTYQREHAKTTIGIDAIDREQRRIGYFHNSGYYLATGEDYDALLGTDSPERQAPYVECAKRRFEPLRDTPLREASLALLRRHLKRRPHANPIASFRQALARDAGLIAARPIEFFHAYSFNTLRQLGANFELLGHYLRWLQADASTHHEVPASAIAACDAIASESVVLEFRLARSCARSKEDRGESSLDVLEAAYDTLFDGLNHAFIGSAPAASPQ